MRYTASSFRDKVEKVEELLNSKREKEKLAFVGDGINDAPVLGRRISALLWELWDPMQPLRRQMWS